LTATVRDEYKGYLKPEPDPREVHYTVISVDDHIVEPKGMFQGRLPKKFENQAPRVVPIDNGEAWVFEEVSYPQLGFNAMVGREGDHWTFEPTSWDDMRPGCWNIHDRVKDMDINGIWASANFPSFIAGFCGSRFSAAKDPELGHAVMQAWNDWMFEEWHGAYPDRIIPLALTWLPDPELGAAEVRRNAARGVHAVSLPELPHRLGYPSLHSGYWDPILRACEETDTVVCLHVGSAGLPGDLASDGPEPGLSATLFQAMSLNSCADWLWSGVALRFPGLRIAMSEGGIGWVPMLKDRLEFMLAKSGHGRSQWPSRDVTPTQVLERNFWFCTIDDPSSIASRHRIGIDRIMVETDSPHADSTWPDSQQFFVDMFAGVPEDEIRLMTHGNAAALFRHPLPAKVLP
jgi:predicted TIM-barrel fold metal-dependent hydrolase